MVENAVLLWMEGQTWENNVFKFIRISVDKAL